MRTLITLAFAVTVKAAAVALTDTGAGASMGSVDFKQVTTKEKPLHCPPLQEIADVLSRGLPATFESVSVAVVDPPDLTQPPFNLVAPGLRGNEKLIELGGPPYLLPLVQRDKIYDLVALAEHLGRGTAFLAGAGAGPWPHVGVNCEGVINFSVHNGNVEQGTRVVSVEPVAARKGEAGYLTRRLPRSETRVALMGNYLLSDGKPGKALKIEVKKRIGQSNFITAIRETLKNHYGDKVVGLGGVFVVRAGRIKHHVMPDFSPTPLCSDADVDGWLHYFEVPAPITHVGTLVTGDMELDLRLQHFHGWGEGGAGGHYHYDVTPASAHYEGYFVPAAAVVRLDAPADTHGFGRD